ncbi:transposase [Sorangium sp. So ce764]|uniref:transposase n=1 Tax=Sorangium sp. So ce764 TaxID=3133320 RepID=UPI003F5F5859
MRTRIVEAYDNQEGSVRELAERFAVAPNTVQNYLNLRRQTGSLTPHPSGGAVPSNPDPNLTLTLGLRLGGFVAPFAFEGATDGVAFRAYVEHQLAPRVKPGDVIILDNLGAHHAKGVDSAIEAVGAKWLFLPPYSPDLSPVEKCGSKIKALMRAQAPRTRRSWVGRRWGSRRSCAGWSGMCPRAGRWPGSIRASASRQGCWSRRSRGR